MADRVRVGEQMEDAFAHAAEEMDTPELKFLAITLSVQRETGGNLAETLANLSEILRKRRQMQRVASMSLHYLICFPQLALL